MRKRTMVFNQAISDQARNDERFDQMHRYRDAIYYGEESTSTEESAYKKEVIGGYILFLGRGANFQFVQPVAAQMSDHLEIVQPVVGQEDEEVIGDSFERRI